MQILRKELEEKELPFGMKINVIKPYATHLIIKILIMWVSKCL